MVFSFLKIRTFSGIIKVSMVHPLLVMDYGWVAGVISAVRAILSIPKPIFSHVLSLDLTFSATFHFPEINFGFLLRHMKRFPEKHIFRKTPQKPTFSAVKSDYAPRYAVCWSKLRSPQNRERTVNTGATKAILN